MALALPEWAVLFIFLLVALLVASSAVSLLMWVWSGRFWVGFLLLANLAYLLLGWFIAVGQWTYYAGSGFVSAVSSGGTILVTQHTLVLTALAFSVGGLVVIEFQTDIQYGLKVGYDCVVYPAFETLVNFFLQYIARAYETVAPWWNDAWEYILYDDHGGIVTGIVCMVRRVIESPGVDVDCEPTYKAAERSADGVERDEFGRRRGIDLPESAFVQRTKPAAYYRARYGLHERLDLNPLPLIAQFFDDIVLHLWDGLSIVLSTLGEELLEVADETDSDVGSTVFRLFAGVLSWTSTAVMLVFRVVVYLCDLLTGAINSWDRFVNRTMGYTSAEIADGDAPSYVRSDNSIVTPLLEDIRELLPKVLPLTIFRDQLTCVINVLPALRELLKGKISIEIFVDVAKFLVCFIEAMRVKPFYALAALLEPVLGPFTVILYAIADIIDAIVDIFRCAVDQLIAFGKRILKGQFGGAFKRLKALITECFIEKPKKIGAAIKKLFNGLKNIQFRDVTPLDPFLDPCSMDGECTSADIVGEAHRGIKEHLTEMGIHPSTTCGSVLHAPLPLRIVPDRAGALVLDVTSGWDAARYAGCAFLAHMGLRAIATEAVLRDTLPVISRSLGGRNTSALHDALDERAAVPSINEFLHWDTAAATLWRGQRLRAHHVFYGESGRLPAVTPTAAADYDAVRDRRAVEQHGDDVARAFERTHAAAAAMANVASALSGEAPDTYMDSREFGRGVREAWHVGMHPEHGGGMTLGESVVLRWRALNVMPRLGAMLERAADIVHDSRIVYHPVVQGWLGAARTGMSDAAAQRLGIDPHPVTGEMGLLLPVTRRAMYGHEDAAPDPHNIGAPPPGERTPTHGHYSLASTVNMVARQLPRHLHAAMADEAGARGISVGALWGERMHRMSHMYGRTGERRVTRAAGDDAYAENVKNAEDNANSAFLRLLQRFIALIGFPDVDIALEISLHFSLTDFTAKLESAADQLVELIECRPEHLNGEKLYSVTCMPRVPETWTRFIVPLPTSTFTRYLPFPEVIESKHEPCSCGVSDFSCNVEWTRCVDPEIGFYDAMYALTYPFAAAPYIYNELAFGKERTFLLLLTLVQLYLGSLAKDFFGTAREILLRFFLFYGTSVSNLMLLGYCLTLGGPGLIAWTGITSIVTFPRATFNGVSLLRKFPLGYDNLLSDVLGFFVGLLLPTHLDEVPYFRRVFDRLDYTGMGLAAPPREDTYCFFWMVPSWGILYFWFLTYTLLYSHGLPLLMPAIQLVFNMLVVFVTYVQNLFFIYHRVRIDNAADEIDAGRRDIVELKERMRAVELPFAASKR